MVGFASCCDVWMCKKKKLAAAISGSLLVKHPAPHYHHPTHYPFSLLLEDYYFNEHSSSCRSTSDPVIEEKLKPYVGVPYFIPPGLSDISLSWIFMGSPGPGANIHVCVCVILNVQWTPADLATLRTRQSVLISGVTTLQGVNLYYKS